MARTYLGDGVYANFDGYYLWVTAENGLEVTDKIALDSTVWNNLKKFAEGLNL